MGDAKINEWLSEPAPAPPPTSTDQVQAIGHYKGESDYPLNSAVWANKPNTVTFQPTYYHQPETEQQIYEILTYATQKGENVKVIGSGCAYTELACTDGHLISLSRFNRLVEVDRQSLTVTTEAGITLEDLSMKLVELGMSINILPTNLTDTVGGVLAVGLHGSSINCGIVAKNVLSLQIIFADCSKLTCSPTQHPKLFKAALCSLGALGIIFTVTLQCVPLYTLQAVQYPLPFTTIVQNVNKVVDGSDYSRFWWFPHTEHCMVWQAKKSTRVDIPPPTVRQKMATVRNKLVGYYSLEFMYWLAHKEPSHRIVPYINRLYHRLLYNKSASQFDLSYKIFSLDNLFNRYVNEWSIPLSNLTRALQQLKYAMENKNIKAHLPVEVTFTKGDDIYLSPSFGEDRAYIGIVMYRPYGIEVEYEAYFEEFQKIMIELDGRPQWAKFHVSPGDPTPPPFSKMYPHFEEFKEIMTQVDPNKLFRNSFLDYVFYKEGL